MIPLLPRHHFQPVVDLLANKRIFFCVPLGNLGDDLIRASERLLFQRINCQVVQSWKIDSPLPQLPDVDFCVWGGGGNFGTGYLNAFLPRRAIFERAKLASVPTVVLPSSMFGEGEPAPDFMFCRERVSLAYYPNAVLVPDLALGYDGPTARPQKEAGYFIRQHEEASNKHLTHISEGDPSAMICDYFYYFDLASKYNEIITDRLHFAIVGLMLDKTVTLLPNSYFKNQAVWDCWLKDLGCRYNHGL
jgi:exopolysaccharide biosynthesis predicted pyruvyltransferase EpsI